MLTNDIFRQEMLHVYEQKSQFRDELVAEARRTMLELADEMKRGVCEHPEAEQLILVLAHELKSVTGKKQYGYLPKHAKKQVDEIVDQMARLPSVKSCYEKWLELQQEVNEFYSDKSMERLRIQAEDGEPYAQLLLGKLYREGEDIPQDMGQAVYWLTHAAEQGRSYAQLLLERQNGPSLPSAILTVNNLLHSIGRIFQNNARTMDGTQGQRTDRKLWRKIQEKKIAMGRKPDDHVEQGWGGMTM